MEIAILTLGAYQTNTYLVWSEGSQTCAVIDPGYEPETILAQVQKLGKTVEITNIPYGEELLPATVHYHFMDSSDSSADLFAASKSARSSGEGFFSSTVSSNSRTGTPLSKKKCLFFLFIASYNKPNSC